VARSGTSSGGTVLAELHFGSVEFTLIALLVVLAALLASFYFRGLNDRVMLVSVAFLLVAVKSSQALLVIPGLFVALKILSKPALKESIGSKPAI
jgi:hypothetical protein